MRLVFDIETDGFLLDLTKIHCIAAMNADDPDQTWIFNPGEIEDGLRLLQSAQEIIGHNILAYDIPALQKIYPDFSVIGIKVTDTLVLSRLFHSDLKNEDYQTPRTGDDFPKKMYGSHSLKAWGLRLGIHKGDFGEQTDWSEWTPSMSVYCQQDVAVNHSLWAALASHDWPIQSIELEHQVAELCHRIGTSGWTFDTTKAAALYAQLALEKTTLQDELQSLFPAWTVQEEFIPKVNNSRLGYKKGVPFIKHRMVTFNPNSRKHIEYCLRTKYDWKPTKFTLQGDAQVDESVLVGLDYPEAQKLARSFMLQKRLGQLAEGKYAWMSLVDADGRLRHQINPLGTVTGRASSFAPNLQQVPSIRAAYGKECRNLFTVPDNYSLVGADLSGIELRCLAHFMPDGGDYGQQIVDGDIHQLNADNMGISRDDAKTVQYALCYGAGDQRLGQILGKGPKEGRALKEAYFKANPAFAALLRQIKKVVKDRGYLIGLDGRHLPVRSEHLALNVLLQSAGALIAKKWALLIDQALNPQPFDSSIIAWVHDEVQIQTKGDPDYVGNIACRMAEEAGRAFGFRTPIAAEYRVGRTWADTH
jgi:DNA polymerase-1